MNECLELLRRLLAHLETEFGPNGFGQPYDDMKQARELLDRAELEENKDHGTL